MKDILWKYAQIYIYSKGNTGDLENKKKSLRHVIPPWTVSLMRKYFGFVFIFPKKRIRVDRIHHL